MSLPLMSLNSISSFSPSEVPWLPDTACKHSHPYLRQQRAPNYSSVREGTVYNLRQCDLPSTLSRYFTSLILTSIRRWVQHCLLIAPLCYLSLENTSSQHLSYAWYFSHIKMNPLRADFHKTLLWTVLQELNHCCLLGSSFSFLWSLGAR